MVAHPTKHVKEPTDILYQNKRKTQQAKVTEIIIIIIGGYMHQHIEDTLICIRCLFTLVTAPIPKTLNPI